MVAETKQRGRPRKMLGPKPAKDKLIIKQGQKPETLSEALADVHTAGEHTGFLGGNIIRRPDTQTESLSPDEKNEKKVIQAILLGCVHPNELSSKSTPEQDKRSLANKLNKSDLRDLKRMLPDRIKRMTLGKLESIVSDMSLLTDEDKAEIQERYKEISP